MQRNKEDAIQDTSKLIFLQDRSCEFSACPHIFQHELNEFGSHLQPLMSFSALLAAQIVHFQPSRSVRHPLCLSS